MKQPSFKINGVYTRKLDPVKELINANPNKLERMFNVVTGKKEESNYRIMWFVEDYNKDNEGDEIEYYCADYSIWYGEILDLVDSYKNKSSWGSFHAKFKDVKIDDDRFKFENENATFSGRCYEDILYLKIRDKKTGEEYSEKLRYIPWL